MVFDFSGKNVIVTGGAQGIGKEIVRGVVAGGGHAIILDLNEAKAQETANELGNCSVYKVDLGDAKNIRAVMAKVLGDFDRVDVLVNCGGVISKVPFQELTDEEWERTIRINLVLSMALNFAAIALAITGVLNPVVGALVHNAGSVLVIVHSALLLRWRRPA